ncbi:type I restriction enzyme S subunit [Kribbella sp. VKM Ac-2569]|uniref:restriction endonuclease subunit S n=1 Tax=Kribbella sp. VKM Ac-2569 TaxID=2512220 RepID=UPI00102B47F7|nr:restriction endonuclease subunit S [Kribbella sp. VKM Ac-2569]RZT07922.1 type I restriction enzyme S subunit [Kribbella sp. VKM Ac-2569]
MSGWRSSPLGQVATLQRGFDLPSRLRRRGVVPIVSSSGVSGWHDRPMVKAPGVVTGRYGTLGEVFFQDNDFWPLNTTLWVSDFHGNDEHFVYYLLQRVNFAAHSGKSGVPGVNRNDLHTEVVSLPMSTAEQREIADALADCDALIVTLERSIAKKHAMKQGMMQELLTGRTRLPGFTGGWAKSALGAVATVKMGQSPAGSSYNTAGQGTPLVQGNADIRHRRTIDRIWTTQPTKHCRAGDVVLTVRAPVGFTAVASKDSCLGRGVCSISTKDDNRFLYHALVYAEPSWSVYEQGSTFTAVNSNEVRSFILPWPTDQTERRAIAAALDAADNETALLSQRIAKAKAMKQGMMQELLTGRTRLTATEALS